MDSHVLVPISFLHVETAEGNGQRPNTHGEQQMGKKMGDPLA